LQSHSLLIYSIQLARADPIEIDIYYWGLRNRGRAISQNSFFIERFDPLVQGDKGETDVLLDRYIAYRAVTGRPVSRKEFVDAFRYTKAMGAMGPRSPSRLPPGPGGI